MKSAPGPDRDPTAVSRKKDHIDLAFESRVEAHELDDRFNYEPLKSAHPEAGSLPPLPFLGKTLRTPIWVSSMTGGTAHAGTINRNLARACAEFGMGLGLGSCRQLLNSHEHLPDFDVRDVLGPELPLYANLGVAQVEQLLARKEMDRIDELLLRLQADGLIVHINPLQEALQPEGDRLRQSPLVTLQMLLEKAAFPIIAKEVGQGFGPASLRAMMQLPLAAIEFGAAGGTNFSKLELHRGDAEKQRIFARLAKVGHTAAEMLDSTNMFYNALAKNLRVRQLIVSGGVNDFLDGFYLIQKSSIPAVYGQASSFLQHARGDYEPLRRYAAAQVRGLELAFAFLTLKEKKMNLL